MCDRPVVPGGSPHGNDVRSAAAMRGLSLVELLVVLLLIVIAGAVTVPRVERVLDHWRTRGAASFLASRLALARMQAVRRNANVGLRFEPDGASYRMRPYADGNRNGLRTAEITSGVDPALMPPERIDQLFPGVRFGFIAGARLIDGTTVSPAADPIRLGSTDTAVFSPFGTATGGTVYLRGRENWQYAVVVLVATGRSRVLEYEPATGTWSAP